MKRIIKFRAWNKEENKMWSFDVMDRNKIFALDSNLPHKDFLVIPNGSHIELMQFTGLTDKNGKEIYEGDIVWDTRYDNSYGKNSNPAEVVFELREPGADELINGLFGDKMNLHGFISHISEFGFKYLGKKQLAFHVQTIEVIGNIYENPELLAP